MDEATERLKAENCGMSYEAYLKRIVELIDQIMSVDVDPDRLRPKRDEYLKLLEDVDG